jgi:ADP-ribose pyrophosphatase YjhB (NUDIX family)
VAALDGWTYCPRCASPLESASGRVDCPACGFVAYANSAPTASAVCVREDGRVLLARRAHEPFRGQWDLPGGFLEDGEHPLDGLRRELIEETSLSIEPREFLGVWMDRYGPGDRAPATLNLYWTASVTGGRAEPADDVSELRWFAPDELPDHELAFAANAQALSAWRNQHA